MELRRANANFGFYPNFVPLILNGTVRQTIRPTVRCKPGFKMHMFTGLRTKRCEKFAVRPCLLVDDVIISPEKLMLGMPHLHPTDEDEFAAMTGFPDYADMCKWFYRQYGTAYFYPRVLLIGLASYAGVAITVPLLDSAWPIPVFLAACLAGDAVVYVRAGRIQEAASGAPTRKATKDRVP